MALSKKTLALLAATTLGFGLVACTDSGDNGAAGGSGGDKYVLANGTEPQNPLIPSNTNEVGGGRIVDMIYSGLVYYDAEGEIHNEMAESIEPEGEKSYRVTLKDGWTFADGTEITAQHFVDTWNHAVANSHLSAYFFEP
ncbi:MAG: ABC transporter substrate-binding protein, partial [Corynebacterium humireducens]|nr:ABC transporter substrate-binding protein [Corynebacterium humireducens]